MRKGGSERLRRAHLHLAEAVVGHLVHEAVEQGGRAGLVHPKLPLRGEVVAFLEGRQLTSVTVQGHWGSSEWLGGSHRIW